MEVKAYYSPDDELFHIVNGFDEKTYKTFKRFAKALGGSLGDADLESYNFEGIDLTEYDYKNAGISIDVLKEQGLYNEDYFEAIVSYEVPDYFHEMPKAISLPLDEQNDILAIGEYRAIPNPFPNRKSPDFNVGYISDLHLDFDLKRQFPNGATNYQIKKYLHQLIQEWTRDSYFDYTIICGDVSGHFELTKLFYQALAEEYRVGICVIIPGNHELWNFSSRMSIEDIIKKYRQICNTCNKKRGYTKLIFLNNALHVYHLKDKVWSLSIFQEQDLLRMEDDEIIELAKTSRVMILGALGFTGCEDHFNAELGIYREACNSLEKDKQYSAKTERFYLRLSSLLKDHTLIVATHMPLNNWMANPNYNSEWIYVSGHTHYNSFEYSDQKKVFSDNQIGYSKRASTLKTFKTSKLYNTFIDHSSGIHEITVQQYREYCIGINIQMSFKGNGIDKLYLLKKNDYCMFVMKNPKGRLLFLEGGRRRTLNLDNVEAIYSQMARYIECVDQYLKDYHKAISQLSREVITLGGWGTIHGCIVDISYTHHLFLNPYDGQISAYEAADIVDKVFYKNPISLIEQLSKRGMLKKVSEEKGIPALLPETSMILSSGLDISTEVEWIPDTWQYEMSRKMMNLQRIKTHKVIREWNEDFANSLVDSEYGEHVVKGLLEGLGA